MNNKRLKAVAMHYDEDQSYAPKLTALGEGLIAENIINKAKENDVPIVEDHSLVELLSQLNINETIPEELYAAVAEVFAFIYQMDQSIGESRKG